MFNWKLYIFCGVDTYTSSYFPCLLLVTFHLPLRHQNTNVISIHTASALLVVRKLLLSPLFPSHCLAPFNLFRPTFPYFPSISSHTTQPSRKLELRRLYSTAHTSFHALRPTQRWPFSYTTFDLGYLWFNPPSFPSVFLCFRSALAKITQVSGFRKGYGYGRGAYMEGGKSAHNSIRKTYK